MSIARRAQQTEEAIMTPSDLRAEVARQQLRIYDLAPQVGVHPGRLGSMLRESLPMPTEVAERLTKLLVERRGQ